MARVLIAWELGEAFGHLARCLQLAEGLRQRGHKVTLALKDVRLPGGAGAAPGLTVLAAPLIPQHQPLYRPGKRPAPVNYADILLHSGFADAQDLRARLQAWQGIISLVCPDVLVADHAPTALLAAHVSGVPHMAVGNGFTLPPAVFPWPSIRPDEVVSEMDLQSAESRLNRVTETAQILLGLSEPVRMRDLFDPQNVLDTFAELDHYGARPDGHYVGPIFTVPRCLRTNWQGKDAPRMLAYLRPEVPGFVTLVQALAKLDAEVLCVAPGLSPEVAKRMATRHLRIALAPVDLPPLFEHADLAISYGNSGFSTQSLLAGVPLLMRPRHVEQALFAQRVEALGAGQLLAGRLDVQDVAATVLALIDEPVSRQAARDFAQRHCNFTPQGAVDQTLAAIEKLFLATGSNVQISPAVEVQEPCNHEFIETSHPTY